MFRRDDYKPAVPDYVACIFPDNQIVKVDTSACRVNLGCKSCCRCAVYCVNGYKVPGGYRIACRARECVKPDWRTASVGHNSKRYYKVRIADVFINETIVIGCYDYFKPGPVVGPKHNFITNKLVPAPAVTDVYIVLVLIVSVRTSRNFRYAAGGGRCAGSFPFPCKYAKGCAKTGDKVGNIVNVNGVSSKYLLEASVDFL